LFKLVRFEAVARERGSEDKIDESQYPVGAAVARLRQWCQQQSAGTEVCPNGGGHIRGHADAAGDCVETVCGNAQADPRQRRKKGFGGGAVGDVVMSKPS